MADRIIIDSSDLMKQLRKMGRQLTTGDQKEVRKIMADAVKPWKTTINSSIYEIAQRKTGKLSRAMGIGTFVSYRKGIIGAKVRPVNSRRNKQSAGWRVHFFASPARQMKSSKRFPFQTKYKGQQQNVLNRFMSQYSIFVEKTIKNLRNA